jgi:hypothetical protein
MNRQLCVLLLVLISSCAERLPLVGAPCPCSEGLVCDAESRTCKLAPAPLSPINSGADAEDPIVDEVPGDTGVRGSPDDTAADVPGTSEPDAAADVPGTSEPVDAIRVFDFDALFSPLPDPFDDPDSPFYRPTAPTALPPGSATPERVAECHACEERNRGGLCVKNMGCDGLEGQDLLLCRSLRSCLRANPLCNTVDPALCYCGNHFNIDCLSDPIGPCMQEGVRATKTTDLYEAAVRYYRPEYPSGRASQVSACDIRACRKECLGLQL